MKYTSEQKEKISSLYEQYKGLNQIERLNKINEEVGVKLSVDGLRNLASSVRKTLNLPKNIPDELQKDLKDIVDEDIASVDNKKEHREVKGKYNELLIRFNDLEDKLEDIVDVKNIKPRFLKINPSILNSEATAVWVASDWHLDEVIDPATINYMNEFNPKIAEDRAKNFFKNGLRLTDIMSKDIKIEHILMAVLGDMISGYIHPELIENNSSSPTQALIKFRDILVSGIKYILDNSNYKLTLVCKMGNHGRTTDKIRVSTGYKNNYEWLIYHLIANEFKDNERVNFIIEDGYHTYFKVYDYTLRFHHGDAMKFGGGVGGLTIPVNKAIAQWNKGPKKADLDVFGHFHTSMFHKDFVSNGSLVGYNSYAERIKADYEVPQQAFFLMDKDRGKTIMTSIFLD